MNRAEFDLRRSLQRWEYEGGLVPAAAKEDSGRAFYGRDLIRSEISATLDEPRAFQLRRLREGA